MNLWTRFAIAAVFLDGAVSLSQCRAQEIVLRDLTRIRGVSVRSVGDDGVRLADERLLTWDLMLQASVDDPVQGQLDNGIAKFGLPLFRLKHRIKQQNIAGAYEVARLWYHNPDQSFANPEAKFLVARTVMLYQIHAGNPVGAVAPMIEAIELQRQCSAPFLKAYASVAFRPEDLATDICSGFVPAWTNTTNVENELNRLDAEFDLDRLVGDYPGLAVYLSSMANHTGQRERAAAWNEAIGKISQLRTWQRLLTQDLGKLPFSRAVDGTSGAVRVTTMFWWAMAKDQSASRRKRLLVLLKILANYQQEFPALADLARKKALELSDDPALSVALEKNL